MAPPDRVAEPFLGSDGECRLTIRTLSTLKELNNSIPTWLVGPCSLNSLTCIFPTIPKPRMGNGTPCLGSCLPPLLLSSLGPSWLHIGTWLLCTCFWRTPHRPCFLPIQCGRRPQRISSACCFFATKRPWSGATHLLLPIMQGVGTRSAQVTRCARGTVSTYDKASRDWLDADITVHGWLDVRM